MPYTPGAGKGFPWEPLAGVRDGNLYQLSLFDPPTLKQLITMGAVNSRTERSDIERMRRIAPPGTDLTIILNSRRSDSAIAALRAAVTKFFDRTYEQIETGMMMEDELQLVLATLAELTERMREFSLDVERRMNIELMRTVNPPMWEDDENER